MSEVISFSNKDYYSKISSTLIRDIDPPSDNIRRDVWWAARMLLIYLLDKPMGWTAHAKQVADETSFSPGAIYNYFACLISAGYMSRLRVRNPKGKFVGSFHVFYEQRGEGGKDVIINLPKGHSEDQKDVRFFVHNFIKSGWTYEQSKTQEKQAHNTSSTTSGIGTSGINRCGNETPKYQRESKYQGGASIKEFDSKRSHVHNPAGSKHSETLEDSSHVHETIDAEASPMPCSKSAYEWAKKKNLSKEDCTTIVYESHPFTKAEEWLSRFDARDICKCVEEVNTRIDKGEIHFRPSSKTYIENLYAYLDGTLKRLRENFYKRATRNGRSFYV